MLVERNLEDDLERSVIELRLVAVPGNAPRIADDTVKLATLDGEHQLLRARISGNRLKLGAEHHVERLGKDLLIAAGSRRTHLHRHALQHVLKGSDWAGLANKKSTDL